MLEQLSVGWPFLVLLCYCVWMLWAARRRWRNVEDRGFLLLEVMSGERRVCWTEEGYLDTLELTVRARKQSETPITHGQVWSCCRWLEGRGWVEAGVRYVGVERKPLMVFRITKAGLRQVAEVNTFDQGEDQHAEVICG